MRALFVVLVVAATLLANSKATTSSDLTKTTATQAVVSIQASKTNRRFLRSQKAPEKYGEVEEERASTNALAIVDDVAKALPSLDDALKVFATPDEVKKLTDAIAAKNIKTTMQEVKPLFEKMSLYPNVREKMVAEMKELPQLKSLWNSYIIEKGVKFESAYEIAKPRAGPPSTS
ncbi:hypothetical protein PPTG_07989 [Phytophthora nicotianae INRA-310]|uniref:RxLR effector protein n=4 Tax=Phytophthora nicotianae TaxID=4792 RepID=W2QJF3_PHYN3|nr:hypothetical protein PPTG_07989 [Phytophthora nicotianae INRA-310]ETN13041.1 hypothetical protein PPTG_07989 [Phytophthora nicotianae INRA-310]